MRITRYRARNMRKAPTAAEQKVWRWLRGRRFAHLKFRRQHPYGPFILDFFCAELKLAIELDGEPHLAESQQWHDVSRDRYLERHGVTVIRIWNEEVQQTPVAIADRILGVAATLAGRFARRTERENQ